jgi:hypothetical protein
MYPGEALFSGFGHIAVRIVDHTTGDDDVYDYGTYEAEDPNLAGKFLVGELPYFCQHTTFEDMVNWYSQDFGGILVQELNFTPQQTERLLKQVTFDCLPENAAYRYHHFYNNCSTKLRDLFDTLLDGAITRSARGVTSGRSLRDLIDASLSRWEFALSRWIVFGLLNWEIDAPVDRWGAMFLPWYLAEEMQHLTQPARPGNPPLVVRREVILGTEQTDPPPDPKPWFGVFFLVLLGAAGLLPLAARNRPKLATGTAVAVLLTVGLAGALYGSLLVFSSLMSPYPETANTMALFVFHPLHWTLVAAAIGLWRKWKWAPKVALYYLVLGVLLSLLITIFSLSGIIPQRIWHYAIGALVISGTSAVALWYAVLNRPGRVPSQPDKNA